MFFSRWNICFVVWGGWYIEGFLESSFGLIKFYSWLFCVKVILGVVVIFGVRLGRVWGVMLFCFC